jgi:parallel beta-helix repeat protein
VSLSLSEQSVIHDNIIQDNQKGIHLASSNTNEITINSIWNNNQAGIYIVTNSNNNVITSNTLLNNNQYGVSIIGSTGNIFSLNDFNRYHGYGQNAQDSSTNSWNLSNQGNYWDDYNGYDNNSDGIGDRPYNISGGSNKDYYPLGDFIEPEQPGDENEPPIVLSMLISQQSAVYGAMITFEGMGDDSDGTIEGYRWRSNRDGTLSQEQSFSTTALTVGIHTIYFQVIDNDDVWSEEEIEFVTIDAKPNHKPVAYIDEITPDPAQQGQIIVFRGHGSDSDLDDSIVAYKWISSEDGVIGTESLFSSAALSVGTHTIYFQVQDEGGEWSNQVTDTIAVVKNSSLDDPTNQNPIAVISGLNQGEINKALTFDGSGSSDNDGSITDYQWDFGDEILSTGPSPTHTYTSPGNYTVTLQVTDDDGETGITSLLVSIVEPSSSGDNLGSICVFDIEIPFPLIILVVVLIVLAVISYFILSLRRR